MTTAVPDGAGRTALARVFRRLIPLLFACYVLAFLDRINLGFAALTMNADLGVSLRQFGLAGTIFYVTYLVCEIPSNVMLVRFGARRWISRIMVTWGLASIATSLATGPMGLYVTRALLGMAEAGFVPGVMLYLTYWIPMAHRGRAIALFMTAQPAAMAIGSPISGAIMTAMDGLAGLHDWQWLFVMEGVPTVLLGLALLRLLPDGPGTARWLSAGEREALAGELRFENAVRPDDRAGRGELANLPFAALGGAYILLIATLSTISTWSPLLLKDVLAPGTDHMTVGLVAALPGVATVIAMPLFGASSDRRGEWSWHFAAAAIVSALGWTATMQRHSPQLQVASLTLATVGAFCAMPVLWTLASKVLSAPNRPVGMALLGAIGIVGSIVSPVLNGYLRDVTGEFVATAWLGAGCMLLAIPLVGACDLGLGVQGEARPVT